MEFPLSRRWFARLVVAGLITAFAPVLPAQPEKTATNYAPTVEAARPDAIYRKGKKVRFNVNLQLDQQPVTNASVRWKLPMTHP